MSSDHSSSTTGASADAVWEAMVLDLFRETVFPTEIPRCEVRYNGQWRPVPLEWNMARRLARKLQTEARMVRMNGDVFRVTERG